MKIFPKKYGCPCFWAIAVCLFSQKMMAQTISGNVHTPANDAASDVLVSLTGPGVSMNLITGNDGNFSFTGLPNETYSLCLSKNVNPLNGLSTYDLVLLQKHLLVVQPLGSPYKIIAGDTDNQLVAPDVLDIWYIRELILGGRTDLIAPSWKFVPADYVFQNPTNPFLDVPAFPLGCKTVVLSGNATGQDFVAIKTGDFNGNAIANN